MSAVIAADELTKRYGTSRGIETVSFGVDAGEVFGFLGPNGAGKTTTIRLLLDAIRPTSGSVSIFGLDAHRDAVEIHRRTGYLPGDLRLYDRITGRDLIDYFVALRRSRPPLDLPALVDRLDVDLSRPIRSLSRGNRQKIGLVQALMNRPELIVLDEPTSGLDPLIQEEVSAMLREAAADGRTVFLSSHILPEVQKVADRIAVIRDGRIALIERVETLRARAATHIEVTFAAAPDPSVFAGLPGVHLVNARGPAVALQMEGSVDALIKLLANYEVRALDVHEADLEDMFRQLYSKDGDDADSA